MTLDEFMTALAAIKEKNGGDIKVLNGDCDEILDANWDPDMNGVVIE